MDDDYMDRHMRIVDPVLVQTQVIEVLNEDADLAEKLEGKLSKAFLRELEKPAFSKQATASSRKYAALLAAQREARLRIAADGSARATWLTVQNEGPEAVLHVGIA